MKVSEQIKGGRVIRPAGSIRAAGGELLQEELIDQRRHQLGGVEVEVVAAPHHLAVGEVGVVVLVNLQQQRKHDQLFTAEELTAVILDLKMLEKTNITFISTSFIMKN